jgi:type II secretory pathway pseudopilin PulG/subtilisin-like proprotein convertase family protein
MSQSHRKHHLAIVVSLGLLVLIGLVYTFRVSRDSAVPPPQAIVQSAWKQAQKTKAYHFATRIVQTTHPAPMVVNVGSSSRVDTLYLDGDADLPSKTLLLRLWQGSGRVTDANSGIEVRVEGEKAYGRTAGGEWQPINSFTSNFAPGNDLSAFLVAAKDVEENDEPPSDFPTRSSFTFNLHTPTLANYLRDQLEDQLSRAGELPAGLHLDTPESIRNATGDGEVWIDENGFPIRLVIHLEYPPQTNGERVEVDIQTDFSNFNPGQFTTAIRSSSLALGQLFSTIRLTQLLLSLAFAALILSLFARRRSKTVYAGFVAVIIFSLVVTPLLQSAQARAFAQKQADRQLQAAQQQKDLAAARQAEVSQFTSNWDPHLGQLSKTNQQLPASNGQLETVSDLSSVDDSNPPDNDSDDDGDGLTYIQEYRLGTDPNEKDSDGDQITDDVEVAGFEFNSKMWYTDPLNPDTNNDGLMDGLECPEQARPDENSLSPHGICRDTNGDGTPDVFDRDNDNDGVPDRVDTSPFVKMDNDGNPFTADDPLLLKVDDLQADKPVFVDFQIRPTNPDHLWYAMNVLDWPSGDEQGQVQRRSGNDSTFADAEENPSHNASNGDMRLVPMLEIIIPFKDGHYADLPVMDGAPIARTQEMTVGQWLDTSQLNPYGISVRDVNKDGDLAVYAPINLVADEYGSDRVAFSARMLYAPKGVNSDPQQTDWGKTQQVRVVWVAQMLTDYCQPQESGPCQWETDQIQFVRSYPEDWYLTGLNVQEDHGLKVGIIYEDPSKEPSDSARQYDDWLWAMAHGLDATFLQGRDCEPLDADGDCQGDGQIDITIDEIHNRWDNRVNGGVSDEKRWDIPIDALKVDTYSYPHEGYVAQVMVTETKKILDDNFTTYVDQGSDAPTLLFVQENRSRTANLGESEAVTVHDNQLTIRVDPENNPLTTRAELSWAPYRYKDSEWQSYPIDEYWDKIQVRYKAAFTEYKDGPDFEDIRRGQVLIAQMYYLALYRGQGNLVQIGEHLTGYHDAWQEDAGLKKFLEGVEAGGGSMTRLTKSLAAVFTGWLAYRYHKIEVTAFLKGVDSEYRFLFRNELKSLKTERLIAGITTFITFSMIGLYVVAMATGSQTMLNVLNGIGLGITVLLTCQLGYTLVKALQGSAAAMAQLSKVATNALSKASVIGLMISVGVIWGLFVAQIVMAGVKFGSMAFDFALAQTIAATLAAAIMLAITAIPIVGQILAAIIALFDAVTLFICGLMESDNPICRGITGWMAYGIGWFIYSGNIMIKLDDDHRLNIKSFEQEFVDSKEGMTAGSGLAIKATVENHIHLISWADTNYDWKAGAYWWQYSSDTLASSTFRYHLQTQEKDHHDGLSRDGIRGYEWDPDNCDPKGGGCTMQEKVSGKITLKRAGINQTVDLYLTESYAAPAQECWTIPIPIWPWVIPVCYVRTEKGSGHVDIGQDLYYDVFPVTLDEFYTLVAKDGGYAFAWSQDTSPTFPRLKDADGDGLRNAKDGGADPNDLTWDSDHDGLSDYTERLRGSSPTDADSDNDGLTDREEALLRTNLLLTDSDYDGLTDKEEVDGWEFVYDFAPDGNQLKSWVTSDPLSLDGDLDSLSDFQEQTYGFHPRVPSDPHILDVQGQVHDITDGVIGLGTTEEYVVPGDTLAYTATVKNNLFNRYGQGLLNVDFPVVASEIPPKNFVLNPQESVTLAGQADVNLTAASGIYSFTQRADAQVVDWREISNFADMVLHVDEEVGATTFEDSSGSQPPRDGKCNAGAGQCPTAGEGGRYNMALHFDGTNDFVRIENASTDDPQRLTITAWVNPDSLPDGPVIPFVTTNPAKAALRYDGTWDGGPAQLNFYIIIDGKWRHIRVNNALQVGQWQFIAGTYDGKAMRLYHNGEEIGNLAIEGTVYRGDSNGLQLSDQVNAFDGLMDEAAFYPRALTSAEIQALYNRPVFQLLMNEPANATIFADNSGLGHDGKCGPAVDGGDCPTSGVQGISGNAARFLEYNGNTRIRSDAVANEIGGGAYSMGGFFKLDNFDYPQTLFAFNMGNGWYRSQIGFNMYGRHEIQYFEGGDSLVDSGFTLQSNRWYHVMLVVEAKDTAHIYANGEEVKTFSTTHRPNKGDRFTLGQNWRYEETYGHFGGYLDNVVVYNFALSPDQVRSVYETSKTLYLRLNDAPGVTTFVDSSGQNNASCSGDHCPVSGVNGRLDLAATFDGQNDYMEAEPSLSEDNYGLSLWFKTTCDDCGIFSVDDGELGSEGHDRDMYLSSGNLCATLQPGETICTTGSDYADGQWHYAVHTFGAMEGQRIYVDGASQVQGTQTSSSFTSQSGVNIGFANAATHPYLDGSLDEIALVNRIMSLEEIQYNVQQPPRLMLHLDELQGTTELADDSGGGHNGFCVGNHCPYAGVKGQLGLAASFDGRNDYIEVPHSDALMPDNELTLAAWVDLTRADVDQKIIGKSTIGDGYVLGIKDGQLYPEVWDSDGTHTYAQWGNIPTGFWTHLAMTWKKNGELVGYINGEKAGSLAASSKPIGSNTEPLRIGIAPWSASSFPANGRIDQAMLYSRALSASEVRALFRQQAKWVVERQSTRLTVDAEPPSSRLETTDAHIPNRDMLLLVSAADPTSWVDRVELGVSASGGAFQWKEAPHCADSTNDAAWCPLFEPTVGEGRYLLQTSATDALHHVESPAQTYTLLVDDTPPNPSAGFPSGQLIYADRHANDTWSAPLSGQVVDPALVSGDPGSGVESIAVRIYSRDWLTDTVRMAADLADPTWQLNYPISIGDPTGWYTLEAQTTDKVGNSSIAQKLVEIRLDGAPPEASLDDPTISITNTITSTLQLTGRITETGEVQAGVASLRVGFVPSAMASLSDAAAIWHLEEADGADRFVSDTGDAITCASLQCPLSEITAPWGYGVEFDGVDDYLPADFATQNMTGTHGFSFGAWISVGERPAGPGWDTPHAILAFNDASGGDLNQLLYDSYNENYYYHDGSVNVGVPHHYPDDGWFHVMVTIDGAGNGTMYVDGVAESHFHTDVRPDPNGTFTIGQDWEGGNARYPFKGRIDEITLYNRALAPEEALLRYGEAELADSGEGVLATTWTMTVPEGLDGLYQINLLPVDTAGNPGGRSDWDKWTGVIDTHAPEAQVTAEELVSYLSYKTRYTCMGRDFDLVIDSDNPDYDFRCPCQTIAPQATSISQMYYHEVSPWFASIFTDTNHLYQYEASCTVPGPAIADSNMRACDLYGHCTHTVGAPSQLETYAVLDSAVYTPTLGQVINSTALMTVTGEAYGQYDLKTLDLYLDDVILAGSVNWGPPNPGITSTQWSLPWNPTEGPHTLKSIAKDYVDQQQDVVRPVDFYVDTIPPVATIDTTVITTTHRISQGRVRLSGQATDLNQVSRVEVSIDGGDWQPASLFGNDWQFAWTIGDEPANEHHSVTARATDIGGHTNQVTQDVLVDLEVPNPITLSLTSGGQVVPEGDTLRTVPSELDMTWITSTQRTDLYYQVNWEIETTQIQQVSSIVPASGPLTSMYIAGEAQKVTPSVVTRLFDGNSQYDTYGSVYVDSPLTPDFIDMDMHSGETHPYLGWMDSGCSLIGVDRNVALSAQGHSVLDGDQKFYATWDSEALRLAWTGANWDYSGDLFIYLDTTAGGAIQAFNPYTTTQTTIHLPEKLGFGADVLIWVSDARVAHLLTYNGGDWEMEGLTPAEYHFDAGLNDGQTDLYLPFARLGIADPLTSPLGMVAFATREGALDLWGAMPAGNPVNAPNVVMTALYGGAQVDLGLSQVYFWPVLGPGVCPNSPGGLSLFTDSDLHFALSSNPVGSSYSLIGDDLFWLWQELITTTHPADLSESFAFMDWDHPMVGDGDAITYTLSYENQGTAAATNVIVQVTALFGLQLEGSNPQLETIALGTIPPGASGSATFQGRVDLAATYNACLLVNPPEICEPIRHWANLQALPFDDAHGVAGNPIDWLYADHQVDSAPPEFLDILHPERFVRPGVNAFDGYAYDPSGTPQVTLQALGSSPTVCADSTPEDGQWACNWDATAANGGAPPADGATFEMSLQARDGHGMNSQWTNGRTLVVDAIPPEAAFSPETTLAYSGTVVSVSSVSFTGVVTDNHGLASVEACLNGKCDPAGLQTGVRSLYTYDAVGDSVINASTTCGGGEIVQTFIVTDSFQVGVVSLGFNADHARRNDILAKLGSPSGTWVQALGPKTGSPYEARNYDALLGDSFRAGLHDDRGDDNTAEPTFDRFARPDDPLRAFGGEEAAGTWTLTVCDVYPIEYDGVLHRSRLQLKPANTATLTGSWSFSTGGLKDLDSVAQTLEVYATDLAGNRSDDPIRLEFTIDNVAPTLTADQLLDQAVMPEPHTGIRVLEGTVNDGGQVSQMYAFVQTPQGNLRAIQVSRNGGPDWWFNLFPEEPGDYTIWIYAVDEGGNTSRVGPFSITVISGYVWYYPFIAKN